MGIAFDSNPIVYTCRVCGKGILKHVYDEYNVCPYCGTPFEAKEPWKPPLSSREETIMYAAGYQIGELDARRGIVRDDSYFKGYHSIWIEGYRYAYQKFKGL